MKGKERHRSCSLCGVLVSMKEDDRTLERKKKSVFMVQNSVFHTKCSGTHLELQARRTANSSSTRET